MSKTQAKAVTPAKILRRRARRLLFVLVLMVILGGALLRAGHTVGSNVTPVGFWHGVFHGALMPCMMPALLVGRDFVIYAPLNNGHPYKLGYTLGVNGCGLLFFGIFFWRVNRLRKHIAKPVQSKRGEGPASDDAAHDRRGQFD